MTENKFKAGLNNSFGFIISTALLGIVVCNISSLFVLRGNVDFIKIINLIFKIGFPVIIMSAGAVMLSDDRWLSIKEVYKKPLLSFLIPTAVWSLIYALFYIWQRGLSLKAALSYLIQAYSKPVSDHFWLTYCFIAFIVLLPLLRLFTKKANEKLILYAVIIWVISGVVLPFLGSVNRFFVITSDANINIYYGYIGFFLLGYYFKLKKFNPDLLTVGVVFVISSGLNIFLITYFLSRNFGITTAYENVYSPLNTASAICAYFLIEKLYNYISDFKAVKWTVENIPAMAIGIYMSHMIIALTLKKLLPFGEILSFLICLLISVVVSYIFTFAIKRIKGISFIMTGTEN